MIILRFSYRVTIIHTFNVTFCRKFRSFTSILFYPIWWYSYIILWDSYLLLTRKEYPTIGYFILSQYSLVLNKFEINFLFLHGTLYKTSSYWTDIIIHRLDVMFTILKLLFYILVEINVSIQIKRNIWFVFYFLFIYTWHSVTNNIRNWLRIIEILHYFGRIDTIWYFNINIARDKIFLINYRI